MCFFMYPKSHKPMLLFNEVLLGFGSPFGFRNAKTRTLQMPKVLSIVVTTALCSALHHVVNSKPYQVHCT